VTQNSRILVVWLSIVCVVIYLMIVVGGVTRLTQSGLSMVDWQPVMGIVPPITSQEWQETFTRYQQFPEYRQVNQAMSLDQFKSIFYWEYGHRVLGRVIGVIFFVPFVVLLALRRIDRAFIPALSTAFVLGGLQGLMGWYMVKSGLVDLPQVSHYRLAAHLCLAILIICFLLWLILDIAKTRVARVPAGFSLLTKILGAVLTLQVVFGAFTAGLKAGHGFNTYPLMHGQFIAEAAWMMQPAWINFLENGVMIQFVHRWLGAMVAVLAIGTAVWAFRLDVLQRSVMALIGVTLLQFVLGVLTLLQNVPVGLGALHQAVGCVLVMVMLYVVYVSRQVKGEAQLALDNG
jgi:cytochrome c oxidase assembly protein subunit 15